MTRGCSNTSDQLSRLGFAIVDGVCPRQCSAVGSKERGGRGSAMRVLTSATRVLTSATRVYSRDTRKKKLLCVFFF